MKTNTIITATTKLVTPQSESCHNIYNKHYNSYSKYYTRLTWYLQAVTTSNCTRERQGVNNTQQGCCIDKQSKICLILFSIVASVARSVGELAICTGWQPLATRSGWGRWERGGEGRSYTGFLCRRYSCTDRKQLPAWLMMCLMSSFTAVQLFTVVMEL